MVRTQDERCFLFNIKCWIRWLTCSGALKAHYQTRCQLEVLIKKKMIVAAFAHNQFSCYFQHTVEYVGKKHNCYTYLKFYYLKDWITVDLGKCFRRNRKVVWKDNNKGHDKWVQFWKERANGRVPQWRRTGLIIFANDLQEETRNISKSTDYIQLC